MTDPLVSHSSRELTLALVARERWAERALVERFTHHVERVIVRVTGDASSELDDRVQETFVRVLARVASLRDPASLPGFVTQVAVNVSREAVRARRRRRWLSFLAPADIPERPAVVSSEDVRGACQALYQIVDVLGEEARTMFLLRHVEGMELEEVARACGVSLATVKRRLREASRVFSEEVQKAPDLEAWVSTSGKWSVP